MIRNIDEILEYMKENKISKIEFESDKNEQTKNNILGSHRL
jgi:hypothetical protein